MKDNIISLVFDGPDPQLIKKAALVVKAGGITVFPTDTVYGIGAGALNEEAITRVYQIKKRSTENPLPILAESYDQLRDYVKDVPAYAERLMEIFWPGALTLVVKKKDNLPDILTAGHDSVGVRVPDCPVCVTLIRDCGFPLAATSANLSGKPDAVAGIDLAQEIIDAVDIVLDSGPVRLGRPSTVVDVTGRRPKLLRVGAISRDTIESVVRRVLE